MPVTLPYYSSLNSQMAAYNKQIKMQEYNDTYQQAQLDIVLDGERNLASQAEIMNRLNQLQQEIANQSAQKIIPLTAPSAVVSTIEERRTEKFPGTTAAQYEDIMRKRSKIELNKQRLGADFLEPKPTKETEKSPIISKEKQAEINKQILEKFPKETKKETKQEAENKINNEINKNLKELTKSPKISTAFIEELKRNIINPKLKSIKKKDVIPFKKELLNVVEKLAEKKNIQQMTENDVKNIINNITSKEQQERSAMQREDILLETKFPKKKTIKLPPIEKKISPKNTPTQLSPTSTEATFQQSSMGSPEVKTKKTLTGKTVKEINSEFAKIKLPVKIENIEIRVERGQPIYKDLNSGIDIVKPDARLLQKLYNQYKIQTGSGIKQRRNAKGQFIKLK